MPTVLAFTERPALKATSLRCPQCLSYARLQLVQPDPNREGGEWRTFECEECGLPRTYAVLCPN
jgi:hypothetical protein